MPKINVLKSDLYRLAGLEDNYPFSALENDLMLVKGELGSRTADGKPLRDSGGQWLEVSGDTSLRIELADTNRPDLWCVEGIARQIRDHRRGHGQAYDFYTRELAGPRILVDPRLQAVRPFIGGFLAQDGVMDEAALLAFIDGQETLDRNFGRRRKAVSIGLYAAENLRFPVQYRAVGREEIKFVPLTPSTQLKDGSAFTAGAALTPNEILDRHPTGQEYAWTLEDQDLVPLLSDAAGEVLSLIPIINSAGLGRVTPGTNSLFVEATGMDLNQVLLTLNILAANLADRGWTIHPVTAEYPYDTPHGRLVTAPHFAAVTLSTPLEMLNRLLGEQVRAADVVERLTAYGVSASADGETITATAPSYRQDYLHPVDVIEDFAISRGYASFTPLMPGDLTVGKLRPLTGVEDLVRDLMIGLGFEEAICNFLTGVEPLRQRMAVEETPEGGFMPFHGGPAVRIQNVMNINYAVLRDWVLPSLLEIESRSEGAVYPHRIFEVGEVAVYDLHDNMGSRTESRLAALMADEAATFDSVQSVVYALLNALKVPFSVVPCSHPSMIPGRAALVLAGERAEPLGFLGEFSPLVLTRWGARVPAAGMELSVNTLMRLLPGAAQE